MAPTTAGNLLLVGINAAGGRVTTVNDNKSDAFTRAVGLTTSGQIFAIYYAKNVPAGVTSVTVTFPYGSADVIVAEYSGADTVAPLDRTASRNNGYHGGTSYTSNSTAITSQPSELAWGFSGNIYSDVPVWTAGAGWTGRRTQGYSFAQEQILSAAGTYAATGTMTNVSSDYQIDSLIATFKAASGSPPPPDTIPPAVSISSPANGATVSGTVSVTASASDNVAVANVQFKLDGGNLGSADTAPPYAVSWNTTTASEGSHVLTAIATDTSGNSAAAIAVTVTVSNVTPPSITSFFASPSSIPSGSSTSLVWSVSGSPAPSLSISGVGSVTGTSISVSPAQTTTYTLTATNSGGTVTAQTTVTVTPPDTTPPTVSITAPAPGSTVSGVISVTANAADNVAVASVQFQLDGVALGAPITSGLWAFSWNTASVADGSHTLTAVAKDTSNNSATSGPVAVTVHNLQPPSISSFSANPATITSGASSTLSWSVSGATSLSISGIGTVTGTSTTVSPTQTTAYTLTATNNSGSATAQTTVTVNSQPAGAVNIILDSDFANNADDVGDHALLWALAKRGEANVLALITSSSNDSSAPAVHAVAKYYGHPSVPIGAYHGNTPNDYSATNSYYAQDVADQFGTPGDTRANYPDAVTVYRQALAAAPDHSVYIVAGGFYEPLSALLQSAPDAISPLSGTQLVAQKVAQLVPAAGWFPDSGSSASSNFGWDPNAASYVFANWPTAIVSVGTEVGADVITGPAANANPNTNPIKLGYNLYCGNGAWCPNAVPAWTQVAVLYAIRGGVGTIFSVPGQDGHTVVWNSSQATPGRNIWSQTPNTGHSYIEKIVPPANMQSIINPLIQAAP